MVAASSFVISCRAWASRTRPHLISNNIEFAEVTPMLLTIFAPRILDDLVVEWGGLVIREKDPNRIVTDDKGNKRYIGDDDPILGVTGKWMWNPPQWLLPHNNGEDYWNKRRDGAWYHGNGGFDLTSYNIYDADDDVMMRLTGFYPLANKQRQGEGTMERGDDETVRCWWQMPNCYFGPKYVECAQYTRIWPVHSKPL
jgi:hypothetical protein